MGRSLSAILPIVALISVASTGCPGACLAVGPYQLEWIVDERTGCCVEHLYRTGLEAPSTLRCTCSCSGSVCAIDQPVGSTVQGFPIGCGARCTTHITVDLACDSAP
jgi:hypothetical protein